MHIKDLRTDESTELGNIIEATGDYSLLCATTDKGYRIVIDRYNMKIISDFYISHKDCHGRKYTDK